MMSIGTILGKAGKQAIDLLFPPRCVICGRLGSFLCPDCRSSLPRAGPPRCAICWQPTPGRTCGRCEESRPSFNGLRSPYIFEGGTRELVHRLKYQNQSVLAGPMADLVIDFLADNPLPADVLVPVPLFPRRMRVRGYNQSALLAQALARQLGLPVNERTLNRTRNTTSQARTNNSDERRTNVREAFTCRDGQLAGERVLLVDDVLTTGATLDACARALQRAGVESVWALTFAHED